MPIPIPPLSEQAVIIDEVQKRLSIIETTEMEARRSFARSEAFRQSILKKAFNGSLVDANKLGE